MTLKSLFYIGLKGNSRLIPVLLKQRNKLSENTLNIAEKLLNFGIYMPCRAQNKPIDNDEGCKQHGRQSLDGLHNKLAEPFEKPCNIPCGKQAENI